MTTQNWIKSKDGSFAISLEEIPFPFVKNSDVPRFSIMWWDKGATNPNATLMDLLNIVAPDPDIPMPITQKVYDLVMENYGEYLKVKFNNYCENKGWNKIE
tara:strand:+ start:274 stop:576 length:303 start_codon:yes stop_codon:yes gene_type:complete